MMLRRISSLTSLACKFSLDYDHTESLLYLDPNLKRAARPAIHPFSLKKHATAMLFVL